MRFALDMGKGSSKQKEKGRERRGGRKSICHDDEEKVDIVKNI